MLGELFIFDGTLKLVLCIDRTINRCRLWVAVVIFALLSIWCYFYPLMNYRCRLLGIIVIYR